MPGDDFPRACLLPWKLATTPAMLTSGEGEARLSPSLGSWGWGTEPRWLVLPDYIQTICSLLPDRL